MYRTRRKSLFDVWIGWTVAIGAALLAVGFWQGFDTPLWSLAAIAAGLLEIRFTWTCIRSWVDYSSYRWFWWR